MNDIFHPLIFLFPTLCVSFYIASLLNYHASLVFIALLSALALISGALTVVIPLSQAVSYVYIALYIISIIVLIAHRKTLLDTIKTNWVWVITLTIMYSLWLSMDRLVTRWDNFSHWLLAPKTFNFTSEIFSRDLVDAFSYPPFNPLFLYFSKGFGIFKEDYAVFLHLALFLILCVPFVENILKNASTQFTKLTAGILSILTVVSFLNILLLLTAEIQSFYADVTAMLLIGLSSFLLYKLISGNSLKTLYLITPLVLALTLIRPGGLAIAFAVIGTYLVAALFLAIIKQTEWAKTLTLFGILLLLLTSCFSINRLWESSVVQRYGSDAFVNNMNPKADVYLKILFDKEDEKAKPVRQKVIDVFTKHTTMLPRFGGSLVEKLTKQKLPNTMGYWLAMLLILYFITLFQLRGDKKQLWLLSSAFVVTIGALSLYMLSILVTAYNQRGLLGGFPRYSFIYIAGIMLYFFLVIFSNKRFQARAPLLIFNLIILSTTPFVLGTVFKNPTGQVRDVTLDNQENLRRHKARAVIEARAQNALSPERPVHISPGDKAYIIWQGNNSYAYWVTRGELGGVITSDHSCPHVVVEKQNKIMTRRCSYSPQELLDVLKSENYDWLFVGHGGEGFREYVSEIIIDNLPRDFVKTGKVSFLLKVTDDQLRFIRYLTEGNDYD